MYIFKYVHLEYFITQMYHLFVMFVTPLSTFIYIKISARNLSCENQETPPVFGCVKIINQQNEYPRHQLHLLHSPHVCTHTYRYIPAKIKEDKKQEYTMYHVTLIVPRCNVQKGVHFSIIDDIRGQNLPLTLAHPYTQLTELFSFYIYMQTEEITCKYANRRTSVSLSLQHKQRWQQWWDFKYYMAGTVETLTLGKGL